MSLIADDIKEDHLCRHPISERENQDPWERSWCLCRIKTTSYPRHLFAKIEGGEGGGGGGGDWKKEAIISTEEQKFVFKFIIK